jgi:aspartate racemase
MGSDFYQKAFSARAVEIIVPNGEERAFIHEKYLTELLQGVFLPETREPLLKIIDRMTSEEKIQALILAGTELPLILRDVGSVRIPFLNTTQIHVEAAVSLLLRDVA